MSYRKYRGKHLSTHAQWYRRTYIIQLHSGINKQIAKNSTVVLMNKKHITAQWLKRTHILEHEHSGLEK